MRVIVVWISSATSLSLGPQDQAILAKRPCQPPIDRTPKAGLRDWQMPGIAAFVHQGAWKVTGHDPRRSVVPTCNLCGYSTPDQNAIRGLFTVAASHSLSVVQRLPPAVFFTAMVTALAWLASTASFLPRVPASPPPPIGHVLCEFSVARAVTADPSRVKLATMTTPPGSTRRFSLASTEQTLE